VRASTHYEIVTVLRRIAPPALVRRARLCTEGYLSFRPID
jgi:hypothetical protein